MLSLRHVFSASASSCTFCSPHTTPDCTHQEDRRHGKVGTEGGRGQVTGSGLTRLYVKRQCNGVM